MHSMEFSFTENQECLSHFELRISQLVSFKNEFNFLYINRRYLITLLKPYFGIFRE